MEFIWEVLQSSWAISPWVALCAAMVMLATAAYFTMFVVIYVVLSVWLPTWIAAALAIAIFVWFHVDEDKVVVVHSHV